MSAPQARSGHSSSYCLLAVSVAAFFVVTSLYISAHRLLWFDEILSALVSRQPTWQTMWTALAASAEQTPPLYFAIARVFDAIFGGSDFGLRFSSALALGAGLLVTFDIARRLTNGLYGLIAMSLLAVPFVTYYGYEARSYALYFALAASALWLWICTKPDGKLAAALFGFVFLLGIAIHYYFVLLLVPFGIVALLEKRILHTKILAAAAALAISLAVFYPEIARARVFANSVSPVWAPAMPGLIAAYLQFAPNVILPLAVVAAAALARRGFPRCKVPPMSPHERLSWLFLAVPFVAFVLGLLITHLFHDRYIIGAVPGFAVGAACLLWRYWRESSRVSLALLLAAGASALALQVRTLGGLDHLPADSGDYQERTRQVLGLEDTLLREGKQHIVFSWDVQYLETWYYSRHRANYECNTSEARWGIAAYVPLRFVSIEQIVANARQTALIAPSPALADALARAGLKLQVRFAQPQQIVYLE